MREGPRIVEMSITSFCRSSQFSLFLSRSINYNTRCNFLFDYERRGRYMNQNAEKLRKLFLNHEVKTGLQIRRDDFVLNSKSNSWHEIVNDFSIQIEKNCSSLL